MCLRSLSRTAVAVLFLLTTAACSSTRPASSEAATATGAAPSAADTSTRSTDDLEELFWARRNEAGPYTQADVRFMTMMIKHHAQALVMSALAPQNDASPQVQTLAARIANAQRDEIRTMQQWLRKRDEHVPEITIDGTALTVHGKSVHGMDMAGILTQEQIDELAAAEGTTFDRLFLTYMIEHHRGAVTMVDHLLESDGAAQDESTFKLASDIHADQTTEIERMELMLNRITDAR